MGVPICKLARQDRISPQSRGGAEWEAGGKQNTNKESRKLGGQEVETGGRCQRMQIMDCRGQIAECGGRGRMLGAGSRWTAEGSDWDPAQ